MKCEKKEFEGMCPLKGGQRKALPKRCRKCLKKEGEPQNGDNNRQGGA